MCCITASVTSVEKGIDPKDGAVEEEIIDDWCFGEL
jgi:hypothetical protein